jgi:phage terminase large subunit-like protein
MKRTEGDAVIAWIELHCRVPSGAMVGRPITLFPFQREIIRGIYDSPTRRAIVSFGRKSGKTTLSALLMLVHLCGPQSRQNGRLYSTALSRGQAALLFDLARDVVRQSPDLSAAIVVREAAKELACPERGTVYKALSADAGINLGLSPCFVVHDELGQTIGPRSFLYEALESATAAQNDPLSIIISTQAPSDADLLSVLIDDAKTGADPLTKLFLWEAPDTVDPFSEAALRAANPGFDHFINREELMRMAADAKRLPSAEASYLNLNLNKRVSQTSPFIAESVWRACAGRVDDGVFAKGPVYLGLDLSARNDLTAIAMIARDAASVWHVKMQFFAPLQGISERARRDAASYDLWARQGLIEATPGASVDYATVAQRLCEICDDVDVRIVGYDRWRIDVLRAELARLGRELPLKEVGMGFKDMGPALDALEAELLNAKIRHGGNPVLEMCARHAIVVRDPAGNRKLDKSKATSRIDGIVALAIAFGVAQSELEVAPPQYLVGFVG